MLANLVCVKECTLVPEVFERRKKTSTTSVPMAMYALVIERFYFLFSLLVQHLGSASLWHETIHYQLDLLRSTQRMYIC